MTSPEVARSDNRERQVDILHGIAVHGVASLYEGRLAWEDWLDAAHRHGRFGFINTLLIPAQRRTATDVRGYDDWQKHGRQVRRGETAIRVISTRGRARPVFDIAQTDGEDVEEPARSTPAEALARLSRLAADLGLYVDRGQGWTYLGEPARRIVLAPELDDVTAATKLAHQLAHAVQPNATVDAPAADSAACHGVRQVVADSVARLVLAEIGLPDSGLSLPSPRQWAGTDERAAPAAAIRAVGEQVLRSASRLRRHMANLPTDPPKSWPTLAGSSATEGRDELLAAIDAAHRFYTNNLAGSWTADYLADRGFTTAVQAQWEIGHAPRTHQTLVRHLREHGHTDDMIVQAGLARIGNGGNLADLFSHRAVLPLRDATGTLVGFIGRRPDGGKGPKYLNTPGTAVFRKNEILFGLSEGSERLAKGVRPLLVEGPLDAVAVNVTMPTHYVAVAPCGTAITPAHIEALGRRYDLNTSGLVLALDGDSAGRAAAVRSWQALRHITGPVEVALLPEGRDPADILSSARQATVADSLRSVIPLADLLVDEKMEQFGELEFIETRLAAARSTARVIAELPPSQIARQVSRVAARTDIDPAEITSAVASAISPEPPTDGLPTRPSRSPTHMGNRSTRRVPK
ncbi:hypothetical protein BJF79_08735 [Actinomadura sp. CNU-125]|uniref:toprim domain-containing protein n=1 Tax=Actinomadura sp. CNU-125 TaxID=1904961 RepID=UPI0009636724|nr:toprim domain-containing protein [Actinomadura sp. CNU-125]OLT31870.1 hypothetical protein BJF79_08735 [Actinomadura sp. CNU-125]